MDMVAILNRRVLDKIGAILLLLIVLVIVWAEYDTFSTLGKTVGAICVICAVINSAFIFLTPIARITDSILMLYSESQPIIFDFKPKIIDIGEIVDIKISSNLLEYRAIFSLRNGAKIYHGFPAKRKNRIKLLLEFLYKNSNSEIAKTAYNNQINIDR